MQKVEFELEQLRLKNGVSRRGTLLYTIIGLGVLTMPIRVKAQPLTMPIRVKAQPVAATALNEAPSVQIRVPEGVFLIAITRIGNRLVAVGEEGVIIYSDDNGTTWSQAKVPVSETLTAVAFANAKIGWAAGHSGVILKTEDGGASWKLQLNGLQVNQLQLVAAAQANSLGATSAAVPLATMRAQAFSAQGADKPFFDIVVIDENTVFVLGAYRMMVTTRDGGKTWVDWSLHVSDRLSDDLYASAVAGNSIFLVGGAGNVFRSDDGANTFDPLTSPQTVTLYGILVLDNNVLLTYGVAGACFRSTDGGKTWSAVNIDTQDNLITGLVLPQGVMLATLGGQVFSSTPDGQTFTPVQNLPPMSISDVEQAQDGAFIFVGGGGVVRISAENLHI
jgi:photosystem II stability/assembly factor-like uncharacterized protein